MAFAAAGAQRSEATECTQTYGNAAREETSTFSPECDATSHSDFRIETKSFTNTTADTVSYERAQIVSELAYNKRVIIQQAHVLKVWRYRKADALAVAPVSNAQAMVPVATKR